MVDSGASITALSSGAARSAGIEPSSRFRSPVETANGIGGSAERADPDGAIERDDLAVHISDRDDVSLLGMNFLSSLLKAKSQKLTALGSLQEARLAGPGLVPGAVAAVEIEAIVAVSPAGE